MSSETPPPSTVATHPFILDLLAGWMQYVSGEEFSSEYHSLIYDFYQKAGVDTVTWDDDPAEKKDLDLREQIVWLTTQLPALYEKLNVIEGAIYTAPPVEQQDDRTPFETPQTCDVILTDKVIYSALVSVEDATSRADAAEKARALAEIDEVEWVNTYEALGDVDVMSVKAGDERGR